MVRFKPLGYAIEEFRRNGGAPITFSTYVVVLEVFKITKVHKGRAACDALYLEALPTLPSRICTTGIRFKLNLRLWPPPCSQTIKCT